MYVCKHFKLEELVSKKMHDRYGKRCWQFFDDRLLKVLDKIREEIGKPITVNNWLWGGNFHQRGFRENLDTIPYVRTANNTFYNSQHNFGRAVDFDVKGMTAEEVRKWIIENQKKFPEITYMEEDVNWVHIDIRQSSHDGIYLFKG